MHFQPGFGEALNEVSTVDGYKSTHISTGLFRRCSTAAGKYFFSSAGPMEFIWEERYVQVREMMRNPGLHGPQQAFSDLQGIRVLLRVD